MGRDLLTGGFADRLLAVFPDRRTATREIAEGAGVSMSTAARWLRGASMPDWAAMCCLLHSCPNVDARWLVTGETERAARGRASRDGDAIR